LGRLGKFFNLAIELNIHYQQKYMNPMPSNILKKTIFLTTLLTFLVCISLISFGQDVPPPPPSDPSIPVDGGLALILAAGAAFGGKKLYDMRKKNAGQPENK
jgi:hypothetical protein